MRRPLDWIVVSMSLLVLAGNRMLVPERAVAVVPAPPARGELIALTEPVPSSPFAYVREDGSQVYVPIPGVTGEDEQPMLLTSEDLHATSGFDAPVDSRTAVYTWSSPISASTSSR